MNTITLAEAVISHLVATDQLEESNPFIIREYAERAKSRFNVSERDFYMNRLDLDEYGTESMIFGLLSN